MGIEIEVNSLEELCDLMCYNIIPEGRRKQMTHADITGESGMNEQVFNPELEMQKVKEELNELIDNTEGKDKEMYQEILGFADFVDEQRKGTIRCRYEITKKRGAPEHSQSSTPNTM